MSSFSSSFIDQVNTKYEALRLIKDPTRLISLLYSKYGDIEEDFYFLNANILIYNLPTKLNCLFKEMKYTNLSHDYLKRQYKLKESTSRIPKLAEYYKNYHLFFCRPTLRHYKLSKIVCNYQDKKAELFYKNNYQDSKGNNSLDKEEMNKKTSSFSLSSLDNITNNKIIFDKQTKKMLDKSETELKNNNFYNTLVLDSSRSNLLLNNGLISKRSGDDNSFEKCIHAFVDYQYNKNKNKIRKNNKNLYIKNKKIKNIIINNENSNKYSKLKNNISQSQRETHKFYTFKLYNNSSKVMNHKINRISNNNSSNNTNYINKIKMKKKSLYNLSNNRYNTSTTTLLNNKNHKKYVSKKELNLNYPVTTTNKDSKKNKTYVYVNSINNNTNNNTINSTSANNKNHSNTMSKLFSHSNVNSNLSPNHEMIKNLKNIHNNYKNFSKLTEYLKQSQNKENSNNLNQKAALHKKNCLSIGEVENKNMLFSLNNKSRITKKKITINKNLKIAVTNNINNVSEQRTKHTKNKTFDYNAINHTNNLIKSNNISNNEDFNNIINKVPQKGINKMNAENSKSNFTKIKKNSKSKKSIFSPSSKKIISKIPVTQTNSKDKNKKQNLTVKIISPNNRKREFNINFTKDINSTQNKRYNKCLYTNDNNIINNFSNKDGLIKSGKISKYNYCLSPNNGGNNNMNRIIKNVSGGAYYGAHISPTNQLLNSIGYFKRNIIINNNLNLNSNNNIYQKKSANIDNKMHSKIIENNMVPNSCNFNNTTKELYSNNNTLTNSNNNTSINCNDYKKLSRNKKKIQNKKFNNSKKTNNINNKTNSINNQLNYNFIIDENNYRNNINKNKGNINISIEKNNINIKDSILHIDKIYIKKDNNSKNKKNEINELIPRVYSDVDCCSSQHKRKVEIKVGDKKRIKSGIDDIKKNKEKMKFMDYSPAKINYSPKMINVHRNFNLLTRTNKELNNNYK